MLGISKRFAKSEFQTFEAVCEIQGGPVARGPPFLS